jgi:hypothetical protein
MLQETPSRIAELTIQMVSLVLRDLFGLAPIWSGRPAPLYIGCGSGDFAAGVGVDLRPWSACSAGSIPKEVIIRPKVVESFTDTSTLFLPPQLQKYNIQYR